MEQERKYWIKQTWIFNLESMHDKLWCIEDDLRDGNLSYPIDIAGKTIYDKHDLSVLREECDELEWIAKHGPVTGYEFGRIKQIVQWRVEARYMACLKNMSEREAGRCFEDI